MFNYMKSEFFRIKKSFATYIIPVLSLIGILVMVIFMKKFGMPQGGPIDISLVIQAIITMMIQTAPFLAVVVIEIFYGEEFKQKTIGRPIEAGYSRESIFFGKLSSIYIYSLVVIVFTTLIAGIALKIFFDSTISFEKLILPMKYLGLTILALTFFVALLILLSIRLNNGLAKFVIYYFLLIFHKYGGVLLGALGFPKLVNLLKYWPGSVVTDLSKALQLSLSFFGQADQTHAQKLLENMPLRFGITFTIGIFLMVVVVLYFKKKEI